jgi:hypothetical protein
MIKDDDRIKSKADYFARNTLPIHLKKYNGEWLNGYISNLQDEFLIIDEYKKGLKKVFFVDVIEIEEFEVKMKEGEDGRRTNN